MDSVSFRAAAGMGRRPIRGHCNAAGVRAQRSELRITNYEL
ncbi:MAG TPA: hypothetical protein PK205_04450 [Promineifilum sp.]|nr:hypothetical protein [Promineifilum sp.]